MSRLLMQSTAVVWAILCLVWVAGLISWLLWIGLLAYLISRI